MRFFDIVGNIFLLDKHLHKKEIIVSVLTAIGTSAIGLLFNKHVISPIIGMEELIYGIIFSSIIYIASEIKNIYNFIKKYFCVNTIVIFNIILDVAIAISILVVGQGDIFSWILGASWMFSGFLRMLITFSKALFESDIKEYLKIIQIYAYTRAAYLMTILLFLYSVITITPNITLLDIIFMFMVLGLCLIYSSNLSPYMTKHENVKRVILMFRVIKDNKGIKLNALQERSGFTKEYFDKIISRHSQYGTIVLNGKRVYLGNVLEKISRS